MIMGLNKYFLADFLLFLYTYELCYRSGPQIRPQQVA
jgi:hypothetical protein